MTVRAAVLVLPTRNERAARKAALLFDGEHFATFERGSWPRVLDGDAVSKGDLWHRQCSWHVSVYIRGGVGNAAEVESIRLAVEEAVKNTSLRGADGVWLDKAGVECGGDSEGIRVYGVAENELVRAGVRRSESKTEDALAGIAENGLVGAQSYGDMWRQWCGDVGLGEEISDDEIMLLSGA